MTSPTVWQYSHHVLAGLRSHRGPILVVAIWSGEFPGLVGLLNLTGSLTKAQSALVVEMNKVTDGEAQAVRDWLDAAGMTFHTGTDEATELTDAQLFSQFRMYVAALRIADDFGLDAVGIQYQQGLKDTVPASDLAEGLLNNVERPAVMSRDGSRELYPGTPLPHFDEVDEGVAVDSLVTNRIWTAMGLDPATTLHDIRWGQDYDGRFVWVFEISGSVPASHHGGYDKSWSRRREPLIPAHPALPRRPVSTHCSPVNDPHDGLGTVWRARPRFAPALVFNALVLPAMWAFDRRPDRKVRESGKCGPRDTQRQNTATSACS
ncbi:hypothetical protein [Streptomyces sp. NPDC057889]|uniref:hypothetical protein n=1 Tax=unclassified Streptomyces TaxID=2593676 RepID=UPI0036A9179F